MIDPAGFLLDLVITALSYEDLEYPMIILILREWVLVGIIDVMIEFY